MSPLALCSALVAAALAILGLRSIAALHQARSPWTLTGWVLSTAYCVFAVVRLAFGVPAAPWHVEYVDLAIMAGAFVVAGFRREPQAEPWWWPAPSRT